MTTYVIGDIQGCFSGFEALLKKIAFDPTHDKLIAVGDIVARGENSLAVVEYCYDLGDRFCMVLGNHDLHLLAIHAGLRDVKSSDKLDALLRSPKLNTYIDWLRHFPLVKRWQKDTLISHAGLYPKWSFDEARACSRFVETQLRSDDYQHMLASMYGNEPDRWKPKKLSSSQKTRFIINACTRMRYVDQNLALDFACKLTPKLAPKELQPWFNVTNPNINRHERVIFGHWASLQGHTGSTQFIATDTGYVWGNALTAIKIKNGKRYQIEA